MSAVQDLNALFPIVFKFSGNAIIWIFWHSQKAYGDMLIKFEGNSISFNEVQWKKVNALIVFILDGMIIWGNDEQHWNALDLIVDTFEGISILSNYVQLHKVPIWISVKFDGSLISWSDEHPQNVQFPIEQSQFSMIHLLKIVQSTKTHDSID